MKDYRTLEVYYHNQKVGTLAETGDYLSAFEYSDQWLNEGFSISPLSLPLRKGVFVPRKYDPFDGLFGVFYDSLPDGWGRLLVDRLLSKNGTDPAGVSSLTRLAIVGKSGMGALEYRPSYELESEINSSIPLDTIAEECMRMFESQKSEYLDELFAMGGSSGGARPKINYLIDNEEWIVKFCSSDDRENIGTEEYDYSLCAKKCGIEMSDTRLLPSDKYQGYFATKRFDREKGEKVHMVSAGGLLETSHRIPNLDYNLLMRLTLKMTHDYKEAEKLYRLMCFNVFSHNRDDHAKNFSFIYKEGNWHLSPAYDLTYSNSIGGEHATSINGNGSDPGIKDLLLVAENANLDRSWAEKTAEEIKKIVNEELGKYLSR